MSQAELGDRLLVSYQQIQKYERGTTRLTVDRLYQIAAELGISLQSLLIEAESGVREQPPAMGSRSAPKAADEGADEESSDEGDGADTNRYDSAAPDDSATHGTEDNATKIVRLDQEELRILKLYRKVNNPKLKRVVVAYLRTVAESERLL